MTFPRRFLAGLDEITAARETYRVQRDAFYGPDGIAHNMEPEATPADAMAAFRNTIQPPAEVTDSWLLLVLWAFWCLCTEYPIPMTIACTFSFLYFAATVYYDLVRPVLLVFLT